MICFTAVGGGCGGVFAEDRVGRVDGKSFPEKAVVEFEKLWWVGGRWRIAAEEWKRKRVGDAALVTSAGRDKTAGGAKKRSGGPDQALAAWSPKAAADLGRWGCLGCWAPAPLRPDRTMARHCDGAYTVTLDLPGAEALSARLLALYLRPATCMTYLQLYYVPQYQHKLHELKLSVRNTLGKQRCLMTANGRMVCIRGRSSVCCVCPGLPCDG